MEVDPDRMREMVTNLLSPLGERWRVPAATMMALAANEIERLRADQRATVERLSEGGPVDS